MPCETCRASKKLIFLLQSFSQVLKELMLTRKRIGGMCVKSTFSASRHTLGNFSLRNTPQGSQKPPHMCNADCILLHRKLTVDPLKVCTTAANLLNWIESQHTESCIGIVYPLGINQAYSSRLKEPILILELQSRHLTSRKTLSLSEYFSELRLSHSYEPRVSSSLRECSKPSQCPSSILNKPRADFETNQIYERYTN